MKKVLTCLLGCGVFFSSLGRADYEPEKLAPKLARLKTAMTLWETKPTTLAYDDLPRIDNDLGPYRATDYLRFYRGVAAFLRSQEPKLATQAKLALLKEAFADLTTSGLSSAELTFDPAPWRQAATLAFAETSSEAQDYPSLIESLGSLARNDLSDRLVVLYGEGLRATAQWTSLKRLILARPKAFAQGLTAPPLANQRAIWDGLLAESPRLRETAIRAPIPAPRSSSAAGSSGKAALGPLASWQAFRKDLGKAFYANHESAFAPHLDYYAKLLAEGKAAQRSSRKYIKAFEGGLRDLPPSLLRTYVTRMWKEAQLPQALRASELFAKNFRGHPDYPIMAYDRARLLEDSGSFLKAYHAFTSMRPALMGTRMEEAYLFRLAWLAYLSKHGLEAREHFRSYLDAYPTGVYASLARYYQIKIAAAHTKAGAPEYRALETQVRAYVSDQPLNYYSVKLIEEWGLDKELLLGKLAREPQALDQFLAEHPYFSMDIPDQRALELFQELKRLGMPEEAFYVLHRLDGRMARTPSWLAFAAHEAKAYGAAHLLTTNAARVLEGENALQAYISWAELFPRFLENEITAELKRNGSELPYEMVVSLIRQESAFNPKAVSSASARGLMQLMPATASALAKNMQWTSYDLFNPLDNIKMGIGILNRLHKKYNGRLDYMLSAYNAGDRVTDHWVKLRGSLPQDEFIESIPYGETREYVKLIMRNMAFYRLVYTPPSTRAIGQG